MSFELFLPYISKFIIFFGLYFTILWILIVFNSSKTKKKVLDNYPSVSILIPAFNEKLGIEKTIKSCLNIKYTGKLDIYVINDASTDNTLEIAKKFEHKINIIDKKKNEGKAAALNTALKKIKTEFFSVVDADSEVSFDSLKIGIEHFTPEIGAVISKMKPNNEHSNILERIQLIEYMLVGLMRYLSSSIRMLHLTPGVLSIYRTKVVKEVGYFSEDNLTEDFEIAVKIRKTGYLIIYSPESSVYTTTPSDFKVFLKQRIRWSRGFIQTHKKHKDVFFNKKYGLFGIYQFPMNVLGPIIYFLAIFMISFNIYKSLYEFIFKLINAPDTITWFSFENISKFILTLDLKIDLPIFLSFIFLILIYYIVIKFYDYNFFKKQPLKKILAFVIYIMFYNYIYIYVWYVSLIKEFKKENYNWGTKNVK